MQSAMLIWGNLAPARCQIALERAAMLRPGPGGTPDRVPPVGRILQPTHLEDAGVYRVREQEITRSGLRISRVARRSRWLDGSTHLWIARQERAGAGGGSSGLLFDVALPVDEAQAPPDP